LGSVVNRLASARGPSRPVVAAFTATAGVEVRKDIMNRLQMRDPFELIQGFARPNLSLHITETQGNDTLNGVTALHSLVRASSKLTID
jgi:ATP-dependent DNA helicase RecQ